MAAALLLALALAPAPAQEPAATITLEIRIFDGSEEVTDDTRVTIYRAGDRTTPVAQVAPKSGRIQVPVPQGFYDAQAIRERDGRVLTIRWAERLIVMPYPDEQGRHLEVVNLRAGYGALQIRARSGTLPDLALFAEGPREKAAAAPVRGEAYTLFVVPAGRYDVRAGGEGGQWHTGIDVPLDRTRLWLLP